MRLTRYTNAIFSTVETRNLMNPSTYMLQHSEPLPKRVIFGKSCRSCGVRNHFANVCRKVKKTDLHAITEQDGESSDEESTHVEYVTSVTLVHDNIHQVSEANVSPFVNEIYAELIITKTPIKFQIDCGATINILPEKYVQGCNLKPTSKRLRMWNNSEVIPQGTTRFIARNPRNNKRYSIEFVVVRENLVPIIGARASSTAHEHYHHPQRQLHPCYPTQPSDSATSQGAFIIHYRASYLTVPRCL